MPLPFPLPAAALLAALLCFASPRAEASSLSLSQAIDEAFRQSPELQKASSVLEEAKWKRVESLSGFLPSLTGSATHLLDKKLAYIDVNLGAGPFSFPQIISTTTYGLSARMPIFDGFSNTSRYRAAGQLEDAAEHELNWARLRVEHDVVLLYYRALAAKSLAEVARQNLRTLEDHLKDVQNFKRAGVSTNFDVLRVEVQVSEAKAALLDAEDNVVLSKQKLAEALGKNEEARDTEGSLPVLTPAILSKASGVAHEGRHDLLGLRARANALDRLESAASVHLVPKVFLFGDFQHYNNRNDKIWSSAAFRDAYQVGVGVSWNIFDGMQSWAKSKEAVEASFQAEKTLEQAELRSRQDYEVWRRKFIYFCSVFSARQSDVVKSKESVRLARAGRRVGARTNTDLLDAEAESFRAQAGLVNSQLGAIEALLNFELATGRKIYRFY